MTAQHKSHKHARNARRGQTQDTSPSGMRTYGALDLGTNSCRMLIAQPDGGKFRVIDSFSKTVQLGRGLEKHGSLSSASINRAVAALTVCSRKLAQNKVVQHRLVATEACRRAMNGAEFLRRIKGETGLELEIIRPEEEARLAVISCANLVAETTTQLLVVDIGGGSTELVWLDLSQVAPKDRVASITQIQKGLKCGRSDLDPGQVCVVDWVSAPVGVATLTDRFADVEDDAARFALMSCHFEEFLDDFAPYRTAQIRQNAPGFQIIGTSGTVTTVAASHLGLNRYDRNKVDGLCLSSSDTDRVIEGYLKMGEEGRRRDPRIGRDRQALILSGVAILQTLTRIWPTDKLSVADRGLREGLLFAQMSADGVLQERSV